MQRVLRHHSFAALPAFLLLTFATMLPFSGVAAAAKHNACTGGESGYDCDLVIVAPASVPADQPFTVKVEVMNDVPEVGLQLAKGDVCATKVPVSLYVDEAYVGTSTAVGGIATFTISLPAGEEGPYTHTLNANAGWSEGSPCAGYYYFNGDSIDVTAVTFNAGQPIAPCPDGVTCVQVTNNGAGGGSAATLFANDGTFSDVSFVPLVPADEDACGITPADPVNPELTFNYSAGSSTKTVVFALSPNLVTKGIGQYNVCWHSLNPFTPLGGGPPVNTGLLPACTKNSTGPCVLFKTSTQNNGAFIGVSAPANDPRGFAG